MFIRGISNISHLSSIDACDVMNTPYGSVSPETRTSDNTLSIWRIDSMEDFLDAALSIILPMNKIDRANFMIISEDILEKNDLVFKQEDPIKEYVNDSKATHYNIIGLRTKDLEKILRTYLDIYQLNEREDEGKLIITWQKPMTQDYVKKAYSDGKIIMNSLSKDMRDNLEQLVGSA